MSFFCVDEIGLNQMTPSCLDCHFFKEDVWFFLVWEHAMIIWKFHALRNAWCKILIGYANMNATLKGANEDPYSCYANVFYADANANVYACDANVCSWNVYCKNPCRICRHECSHIMVQLKTSCDANVFQEDAYVNFLCLWYMGLPQHGQIGRASCRERVCT